MNKKIKCVKCKKDFDISWSDNTPTILVMTYEMTEFGECTKCLEAVQ